MPDTSVRAIREALGLTQQELATRLQCSIATVRRWEQAGVRPMADFRRKLNRLQKQAEKARTE